ncbi:MAG TPA: Uma2 family endonuclease [Pyrinomonadaceae bacterium]|nr:Uma2 family endonuclease [Pyrinomonadaceae bacterium]
MASTIEPLLTVADLDVFPDDDGNRYELIGGELFVSRAPGIPHQRVLSNLQLEFGNYLKAHPIGILVPSAGAIFSNYGAVIPDLCFVRHERWDEVVTGEKFTGAVDLVVEVTSPGKTNRQRDLDAKRGLYARYAVREYWIVDTDNRSVLIFRLQGSTLQEAATVSGEDVLTLPLLPTFRLKANTVFNL